MFTPQEIQSKRFEKAVFGGYDMNSVDKFLDELTGDYISLYKENATLKGKLKVLVDKIEEYKSVEDAMRKTLYSAQSMANELVEKSKRESEEIISNAKSNAENRVLELKTEIIQKQQMLEDLKSRTAGFIFKMEEFYKNEIESLKSEKQFFIKEGKKEKTIESVDPTQEFKVVLPKEEIKFDNEELKSFDFTESWLMAKNASENAEENETIKNLSEEASNLNSNKKPCSNSEDNASMDVEVFEIQLGFDNNKNNSKDNLPKDTDDDGMSYTPKPSFNFSNLKFGSEYDASKD